MALVVITKIETKHSLAAFQRESRRGLAFFGRGEEFGPGWPAGEWFAGADAGILEDLRQIEPFYGATGRDALALCFEAQSAFGLFVAGNSDVPDGVFHGVSPGRATPR